jgi:hypothetical protein
MSTPTEPDELTEEELVVPFRQALGYVAEWADTDARRDDVMSSLWVVLNRRPKPPPTGRSET